MHPGQMLFEIIQPWPLFVFAGAIPSKAHIQDFRTADGLLLVDAFLMPGQIVDGSEALFAAAVWFIAPEQFPMSRFVFPVQGKTGLV